tara:strand:- start:228 stop:398 length:171 start_codon:yes stop_codon:yes gene_type:complete
MGVVKEKNPEMSRQDLMREVDRMWKENKGDVNEEEEDEEEEQEEEGMQTTEKIIEL